VSKAETIREAFEAALVAGLRGSPVVSKDGEVATDEDGSVLLAPPEAAFLSVVRAYLKDRADTAATGLPKTGKPTGLLKEFADKVPFGARAQ